MSTPIPFVVAGDWAVDADGGQLDALEVVATYLAKFQTTVEQYDGIAGTVSVITQREIDAAGVIKAQWHRNPMSLRATMTREGWFESMNSKAPWGTVVDAVFESADPTVVGSSYDLLTDVWYSFADDRFQKDVEGKVLRNGRGRMSYAGEVQINKILYLRNPRLFPIFDGVLAIGYSKMHASNAQRILSHRRGVNPHHDHFSWEPFRSDLLSNQAAGVFESVRAGLLKHPTQLVAIDASPVAVSGVSSLNAWVSVFVTDLRFMDMLAWWYFKNCVLRA